MVAQIGDPKTWISELSKNYSAIRLSIADLEALGIKDLIKSKQYAETQ